jgi:hypothetical protein
MRANRGDQKQPLLTKPSNVFADTFVNPVRIVRRVSTRRPAEDWKQPPRNLRSSDFHDDGPEPKDLG